MARKLWKKETESARERLLFLIKEFYPSVSDVKIAKEIGFAACTLADFMSGRRDTQRRNLFMIETWLDKQEKERGIARHKVDEKPK